MIDGVEQLVLGVGSFLLGWADGWYEDEHGKQRCHSRSDARGVHMGR